MNKKERCDAVRAMELLARAVNNENFFEEWLISGVADGDIDADTKDEDLEYYVEDDTVFAALMDTFLHIMKNRMAYDWFTLFKSCHLDHFYETGRKRNSLRPVFCIQSKRLNASGSSAFFSMQASGRQGNAPYFMR